MCVVQVHILDDVHEGAEDGLRMPATRDACRRIAPRSLMEAPTARRATYGYTVFLKRKWIWGAVCSRLGPYGESPTTAGRAPRPLAP
jgi:hypothetical protein